MKFLPDRMKFHLTRADGPACFGKTVTLKVEQDSFTLESCKQKMQTELQTV